MTVTVTVTPEWIVRRNGHVIAAFLTEHEAVSMANRLAGSDPDDAVVVTRGTPP